MKILYNFEFEQFNDKIVKCYCEAKLLISNEIFSLSHTINDIGIAKCHPDDEFDPEFGRKLSMIKAKSKVHKQMEKLLLEIIDDQQRELNKQIEELGWLRWKYIARNNKMLELIK